MFGYKGKVGDFPEAAEEARKRIAVGINQGSITNERYSISWDNEEDNLPRIEAKRALFSLQRGQGQKYIGGMINVI